MKPDDQRAAIAKRVRKPASKIKRDAFLYLEDIDGDDSPDFAQCADCAMLAPGNKCAVLGIKVEDGWSCGFFLDGDYNGAKVEKLATPEQAGVYKGKVRCENCRYGGKTCALYDRLNTDMPADFDLDAKIKPHGCCNAFQAKA
jgi:hypothetical protein